VWHDGPALHRADPLALVADAAGNRVRRAFEVLPLLLGQQDERRVVTVRDQGALLADEETPRVIRARVGRQAVLVELHLEGLHLLVHRTEGGRLRGQPVERHGRQALAGGGLPWLCWRGRWLFPAGPGARGPPDRRKSRMSPFSGRSSRAGASQVHVHHWGQRSVSTSDAPPVRCRRGFASGSMCHRAWTLSAMNGRLAEWLPQLPSAWVPNSRHPFHRIHMGWYGRAFAGPSHRSQCSVLGHGTSVTLTRGLPPPPPHFAETADVSCRVSSPILLACRSGTWSRRRGHATPATWVKPAGGRPSGSPGRWCRAG